MLGVRILSYLAVPRNLGLRFPTGGIYSGKVALACSALPWDSGNNILNLMFPLCTHDHRVACGTVD